MMRTFAPLALFLFGCSTDYAITKDVPELAVSPTLTDLGLVAVGSTADAALVFTAQSGEINIYMVDVLDVEGGHFALVDDPPTFLARDESQFVRMSFTPETEGFHWARVTVYADGADEGLEVTIRGEATLADLRIYPSVVDFGPVQAGTTADSEVVLVNEGRVDLELATIRLGDSRFAFDATFPQSLAAGSSLALPVSYTATDESEASTEANFDIGGASTSPVELRANACTTGAPDVYDADADGFSFCANDCNDWNNAVFPGARETCDGVDQDCDGQIDEGTSCVDDDGDGYSEDDGDCNDGDAAVSPGSLEVMGNGIDDDCDGTADDGRVDSDGDGYGSSAGDCDDTNNAIYPGAPETLDGADNDCDGTVDEGTTAYDDDSDGYTEAAGDCDDSSNTIHPGAPEGANWTDDDCDGTVDEGTVYGDDDADGYSEAGGDCDDADATVNPGQPEATGNGKDDDCDGLAK